MFNNQSCTVVSSFTKGGKMYVTLELDMGPTSTPQIPIYGGINLGDFRLEVSQEDDNIRLEFYYGSIKIAQWSIPIPNPCVDLGEQSFSVFGLKVKVKNIQVCVEGDHVCLRAGVYVKNPVTGKENKIGDIHVCS